MVESERSKSRKSKIANIAAGTSIGVALAAILAGTFETGREQRNAQSKAEDAFPTTITAQERTLFTDRKLDYISGYGNAPQLIVVNPEVTESEYPYVRSVALEENARLEEIRNKKAEILDEPATIGSLELPISREDKASALLISGAVSGLVVMTTTLYISRSDRRQDQRTSR